MLNSRLWGDIIDDRLPSLDIVPLDESGQEKTVTSDNFMITVFLYIDDLAPGASTPSLENEVSSI
nr:hypothetical protein [Listeria ilorinensis]